MVGLVPPSIRELFKGETRTFNADKFMMLRLLFIALDQSSSNLQEMKMVISGF